jgi:tetratricopeptide (TPR) repeat protein
MTTSKARHVWADVHTSADAQPSDPQDAARPVPAHLVVQCHRRRRGPYTAGGYLLRHIVPELLVYDADLVAARSTEINAIAPDLSGQIPRPPQTLTNLAEPEERTRFYAVGRTARLAHGITELMTDWARRCHPNGVVVELRELDGADPTDQELVSILIRRCDPNVLTFVVESSTELDAPALRAALTSFTDHVPTRHRAESPAPDGADLAQLYIDSDGLIRNPAALQAYLDLPDEARARRHTARADLLAASGKPALAFGTICYHREHGMDAAGVGGECLKKAVYHCFELGYYHAAMEFAERGYRSARAANHCELLAFFTHKIAACLAYLNRGAESLHYLGELRRASVKSTVHMSCSYMLAMLYTRLLPKESHDENEALAWVNAAIALADVLPDAKERTFFSAFMRNARALVDLHRGDLDGALAQVNAAIEITDATLGPDEHQLHRSVLRYNRAQVFAALGDYNAALTDFDEAIRRDPDYGDYYFDRAAVRRTAGDYAEALADYATAISLTPPFYEAHYNRADLLRELGSDDGALRDLNRALELEPDHVDSLASRADLLLACGDVERAAADIEAGLSLEPYNAHLLSARASLLADSGDVNGALEAYAAALARDPNLVAAWVNRAVLLYSTGRVRDSIDDLDRALALSDAGGVRVNRAIALQDLGEHGRAIEDLDFALRSDDVDPADVLYRRGVSRFALDDVDGALADWRAHLARFEPGTSSPYLLEISSRADELSDRIIEVGVATP